jgi:ribosomal protein S18 acetylase RimI-like enzyme
LQVLVRTARESDAQGIAHAFVDSMLSAYRDLGPASLSAYRDLGPASLLQFSYEDSERNWRRSIHDIQVDAENNNSKECIYVAEHTDGQTVEIVGVAMGGPERTAHPDYQGEVYVLGLLPAYQRHGLGRTLVRAVAEHLYNYHMSGLLIRVLSANQAARKFYEALGGELVFHEEIEEEGVVLDQVGYGWAGVNSLIDGLGR